MRHLFSEKVKFLFLIWVVVIFFYAQTALAAQTAVIATATSNYSSGAHAVVSADRVDGHRAVATNLDPSGSDLKVIAHGGYFYRLERSSANNITKYDINAPSTPIWQFSTEGDESNSNPHDLVFVSDHKAYLIRYGSPKVWIVDPSVSAADEDQFKTGEIDLSAYNDGDGSPEAQAGVIVEDRLYIALQRIDSWITYNTSYISVIDTNTDMEIETGKGESGFKGIPIPGDIKNPGQISYVPTTGKLYVLCLGDWNASGDPVGGIVSIDPADYSVQTIITDNNTSYGAVTGMAILDAAKGYFIGEAGWQDDSLYRFNPSTGSSNISGIADISHKGLAGPDAGLLLDAGNSLWVCNRTNNRVDILNTTTDAVDESVDTGLSPQNIAFADGSPDIAGFPSGGGGGGGGCFISIIGR